MFEEEILICPKCHLCLNKVGKSFLCSNNHCYDIAKENYVNLLLSNQKKTKAPGDDKTMISARDKFLKKGYFERLRQTIESIVSEINPKTILDAGCGTGYYIENLQNNHNTIAVDISKEAVRCLSKNNFKCTAVVASIYDIPIVDSAIDLILNIFAPKPQKEFKRILNKTAGVIVEVVPGKEHLKELKEKLFCEAHTFNKEKFSFNEFNLISSRRLKYSIKIENNDDLTNLLKMTPYYYTGGEKRLNTLNNINNIEITLDFIINVLGVI